MTTQLTPVGGHAVLIDKRILERLCITPETELEVFDNGTWILIDAMNRRGRTAPPPKVTTRLIAVGDGHGVIIDEKLLKRLGISPETKLEVSTDGQCIIVKPIPKRIDHGWPSPRIDHGWPRPPRRPVDPPEEEEPMIHLPKKQPW